MTDQARPEVEALPSEPWQSMSTYRLTDYIIEHGHLPPDLAAAIALARPAPSPEVASPLVKRLMDAGMVISGTHGPIFDAVAIDALLSRVPLSVDRLAAAMSSAYTSVGSWADFDGEGKDPIVRAFAEATLAALSESGQAASTEPSAES